MVPAEVPPIVPKTTVFPPEVNIFPFRSFAVKVSVMLEPDVTVLEETAMVDDETESAPAFTVTAGAEEIRLTPPMLPTILVAVPEVTPVKIAE